MLDALVYLTTLVHRLDAGQNVLSTLNVTLSPPALIAGVQTLVQGPVEIMLNVT